jgi:lysozyme
MARDINAAGIELIRAHEGLRLRAYDDKQPKVRLKADTKIKGTLTIGIGHTGPDVKWNSVITEEEAIRLFRADIDEAEGQVESIVTVPLNDNEFAALVSFTFNCGPANLRKLVRTRLNKRNDRLATAQAFALYNLSNGQVMAGLVRRRADEAALFLLPAKGQGSATTAPAEVTPARTEGEKVATGAAAGGGALAVAVEAAKEASEWTWGLPATIGTGLLLAAVGVALWLWWRGRRAKA